MEYSTFKKIIPDSIPHDILECLDQFTFFKTVAFISGYTGHSVSSTHRALLRLQKAEAVVCRKFSQGKQHTYGIGQVLRTITKDDKDWEV
jgi:hypothetical protein